MTQITLLIIDPNPDVFALSLSRCSINSEYVHLCSSLESALLYIKSNDVHLIFTQYNEAVLLSLNKACSELPIVVFSNNSTIKEAVLSLKAGACEYLEQDSTSAQLEQCISTFALSSKSTIYPIAEDQHSRQLLMLARKVAKIDVSVMILGPSGSGKEVLANYLHQHSNRSAFPFIAVNCAAIPESMLEAILFGYEKGAFTGAVKSSVGKFEQAQNGTILLDEISEIPLNLQAKLLRVLQEKEVERLGGHSIISLNVRVLATSNKDLKLAVATGDFREDLYYRLNVFPLVWLPLQYRPDDIIPLAQYLLGHYAVLNKVKIPKLTFSAEQKLINYSWPGNIRELENVIQRSLILSSSKWITECDLILDHDIDMNEKITDTQTNSISEKNKSPNKKAITHPVTSTLTNDLKKQEFSLILDVMKQFHGKRKSVAEKLGISPRTLRYKLAKMREDGIDVSL